MLKWLNFVLFWNYFWYLSKCLSQCAPFLREKIFESFRIWLTIWVFVSSEIRLLYIVFLLSNIYLMYFLVFNIVLLFCCIWCIGICFLDTDYSWIVFMVMYCVFLSVYALWFWSVFSVLIDCFTFYVKIASHFIWRLLHILCTNQKASKHPNPQYFVAIISADVLDIFLFWK